MELKKTHWIGIISGLVAIIVDFIFFLGDRSLFYFILGIAIILMVFPFIIGIATQSKREQEISEMFLEF